MSRVPLTDEDRASPLWRKMDAFLREELDAARKSNDSVDMSADKTNFIRGRIAVLKWLLTPPTDSVHGALNSPTSFGAGE